MLGTYKLDGATHKIVARKVANGATVILDRNGSGDPKLIGIFGADETTGIRELVADYLRAENKGAPSFTGALSSSEPYLAECVPVVAVSGGYAILGIVGSVMRWTLETPASSRVLTIRDLAGYHEAYEPFVATTRWALDLLHRQTRHLTTSTLRREYDRLTNSRIVLNRLLREKVLEAARERSMSDICKEIGHVKRSPKGYVSGDTNWLQRAVGIRPAKPWTHITVLADIARAIDMAPQDLELGWGGA